jgi:hypothetical protein
MAKKTQEEIDAEAARKEADRKAKEAREKRNNSAVDRRNSIADNADAERQKTEPLEELEEEGDPDPHTNEEGDAEAIAAAQAEEDANEEARKAGAEDVRKNSGGVTEYRLVVNGREKWETLEQIRASAQKVESADEYLRQASESVTRVARETPTAEEAEATQQAEADAKARREHLKDLYRRSALGDEEAIEELAQIQDGLSRVTPDVLRIVDQRVDARVAGTNAFQSAVEWFESEYKEELASPRLKTMAARLDKEFAGADPQLQPRERLKKVGDELREMRKELGGTSRKTNPKEERKRALPNIPAASGRQAETESEEETESTQETIARMAQARAGRTVSR